MLTAKTRKVRLLPVGEHEFVLTNVSIRGRKPFGTTDKNAVEEAYRWEYSLAEEIDAGIPDPFILFRSTGMNYGSENATLTQDLKAITGISSLGESDVERLPLERLRGLRVMIFITHNRKPDGTTANQVKNIRRASDEPINLSEFLLPPDELPAAAPGGKGKPA